MEKRLSFMSGGMVLKGHKVWDCFPFAGYPPEIDILDIRLHELANVVDRFVIVEAPVTHSGKKKPLHFLENKSKFSEFADRIEYVVVDDFPPADMSILGESWKYERHQRDAIARGLMSAQDSDIIISSDLDEIPRAETLKTYDPSMGLVGLSLSMHTYWLNMVNRETEYAWCKVLPHSMAKYMNHCQIRYTLGHPIIPNGGWHFSYLGGPKEVIDKIESFAHQEYNIGRCKDEQAILKRMKEGIDPHERSIRYKLEPLDNTYPTYVLANKTRFSKLINEPMPEPQSKLALQSDTKTVDWNRKVWDAYSWSKDGDEWDEMAKSVGVPYETWKESLVRTFIIPYLGESKTVIEIGSGHGRWSSIISPRVKKGALVLVDLSAPCAEYCRKRFSGEQHVYVHHGGSIPGNVAERSVDFVWSFDTFVHIEESETRAYIREFAKVLKSTGMGVIHHPGSPTPEQKARGARSNVTSQIFAKILRENGLYLIRQVDAWNGGNVKLNGDMLSIFVKP